MTPEEVSAITKKLNNTIPFDYNHPELYFKHRELVEPLELADEGFGSEVILRVNSSAGVLYLDSERFDVGFGDEFWVGPSTQDENLACVQIL